MRLWLGHGSRPASAQPGSPISRRLACAGLGCGSASPSISCFRLCPCSPGNLYERRKAFRVSSYYYLRQEMKRTSKRCRRCFNPYVSTTFFRASCLTPAYCYPPVAWPIDRSPHHVPLYVQRSNGTLSADVNRIGAVELSRNIITSSTSALPFYYLAISTNSFGDTMFLSIGGSRNIGYHFAVRILAKGSTKTFLLRHSACLDADANVKGYVASGQA